MAAKNQNRLNKILFALLFLCTICHGQNEIDFISKIADLKNGYLTRIEIWGPNKCYYFYVYSKEKPKHIDFRITECNSLALIDSTLLFIYIDEHYPTQIKALQGYNFDTWHAKIPIFKKFKKKRYINKELNYYFSSKKCDLRALEYSSDFEEMFKAYWGSSILPKDINSGVRCFIALDCKIMAD